MNRIKRIIELYKFMNFVHFTFIENCAFRFFLLLEYCYSSFIHPDSIFSDSIFRVLLLSHKDAVFCTYKISLLS